MNRYRNALPQLAGALFLTDGGLETTLIFHEELTLPDFAAFDLLRTPEGEAALSKYFRTYAKIARRYGTGLILESPTWRASLDWGIKLGYSTEALADANRRAIRLLENIQSEYDTEQTPVVISGCLGPRGDGFVPSKAMSAREAEFYHLQQIATFADCATDMVCATTMNNAEEALGMAQAAQQVGMPVAISFTVETDSKLPTGQTLKAAIEQIDDVTSGYPSYYMINCAHPTHFDMALTGHEPWSQRIRGIRANASRLSHAQLDDIPELDEGNPVALGREYAELKERLSHMNVMGGCCGTDHRHIEQIVSACQPLFQND